MLAFLGLALYCCLMTVGSSDKLLLLAGGTVKVPYADIPVSIAMGLAVIAPFLLVALVVYMHIESMPTLFSFSDTASRVLTELIFYWLAPLVLVMITWKAWALPVLALPLTYISGLLTFNLVLLQFRRHPDNQHKWWALPRYTIMILIISS